MGALSIAGERERGTLEHLLAQPLSRTTLLLAKHAGVTASIAAATLMGFAPAGGLIAWHAGGEMLGHYLLFPLLACLAGVAMASLGLLISVSSRTAVQAQGAAIICWFVFVLLYDLVLMGSLAFTGMPVQLLAAGVVANPVDAARVLGVLALEPDLYLLGPAGAFLTAHAGQAGTALLLLGSLTLWATVPVAAAIISFGLKPTRRHAFIPVPRSAQHPVARERSAARTEEVTFS
jgi:Cu-processing system permease protein